MSVFSSGSKWKNAAQGALASAQALEDQQKDVDFRRGLLSNIRQQRMAQAQLAIANYSDSYSSSSAAGASANIDSALASEMKYSYESSQRAEDIQNYQQDAKTYMKKYEKQQKTKSTAFSVAAVAGTFLTGGALGIMGMGAGASAASASAAAGGGALAQFGAAGMASLQVYGGLAQGIAQIASNTGQAETGINNIISGASQVVQTKKSDEFYAGLLERLSPKTFETTSIDPKTGQPIAGSSTYVKYIPGTATYLNQTIFN